VGVSILFVREMGLIAGGAVASRAGLTVAPRPLTPTALTGLGMGMNEQEETMSHALPSKPLAVQTKALAAAGLSLGLAAEVKAPLRSVADQLIRSASSVPANIAEGHGRFGRDRGYHYRIAYGSAKEVEVHVQLLVAAGVVESAGASEVLRRFDEVRAMLWRLMNPRE
jgi:four helix bundle protein